MKSLLGILFFCGVFAVGQAQRVCGSTEYVQQLVAANPSIQEGYNKAEAQVKKHPANAYRDPSANEIITIPVVIHVLYKDAIYNISEAQIRSQLDALNADFRKQNADTALTPAAFSNLAADCRIMFCLAQVDPQGRKTTGIIRKSTNNNLFFADDAMKFSAQGGDDAWDSKRYLNIWVCNLAGRSLGYGTPPGGPAGLDGVVIAYDVFGTVGNLRGNFNKGRTTTHEVGHRLGLKHIWGDAVCGSDDVDDTPTQKSYNYGCPSFPHVSTCSPDANGDMFMNFMDFSDDACMNMFTYGQKARMRALFLHDNLRNSFLASFACDSTLAQGGPLPVDTVVTVPVAIIPFLKVYPNPVHDIVTIESNAVSDVAAPTIRIYNAIGMPVYSGKLTKTKTSLSLAHLAKGIYIIKVGEGKNGLSAKIICQ